MTVKLGEHLAALGRWTNEEWVRRAKQGADGCEHYELVSSLGQNALRGTGTWIATHNERGTTASGEDVEIDHEHPLTIIALHGRNRMAALNDISAAMNGTHGFSPTRYTFLKGNLWDIGYQVGMKILKHLSSEGEVNT